MSGGAARMGLGVRSKSLAGAIAAVTTLSMLLLAAGWSGLSLGSAWRGEDAATLTLMVAEGARVPAVTETLRGDPDILGVDPLDPAEITRLLAPFGVTGAWPLPAILEIRLRPGADAGAAAARIEARAQTPAPGTIAEAPSAWRARIAALGRLVVSLAAAAIGAAVATVVAATAVATAAALAERWPCVVILHGLGATDGQIARSLAIGICRMAALGVGAGTLAGACLLLAAIAAGAEAQAETMGGFAVAALACGAMIVGVAGLTARLAAGARLGRLP